MTLFVRKWRCAVCGDLLLYNTVKKSLFCGCSVMQNVSISDLTLENFINISEHQEFADIIGEALKRLPNPQNQPPAPAQAADTKSNKNTSKPASAAANEPENKRKTKKPSKPS